MSLMLLSSSEVLDPSNEGDTKPLTVHQFQVSPDFLLSVKKKTISEINFALFTYWSENWPVFHWDGT